MADIGMSLRATPEKCKGWRDPQAVLVEMTAAETILHGLSQYAYYK